MADSPVTINKPGTMAQAAVAATAPEGMLIAPIWKRVVALALDGFPDFDNIVVFHTGNAIQLCLFN